jgi:hypothetical protein
MKKVFKIWIIVMVAIGLWVGFILAVKHFLPVMGQWVIVGVMLAAVIWVVIWACIHSGLPPNDP